MFASLLMVVAVHPPSGRSATLSSHPVSAVPLWLLFVATVVVFFRWPARAWIPGGLWLIATPWHLLLYCFEARPSWPGWIAAVGGGVLACAASWQARPPTLAAILRRARDLVATSGDFKTARWKDKRTAMEEIDRLIDGAPAGDLAGFFAPDGPLREAAAQCGWENEAFKLTVRFHALPRE